MVSDSSMACRLCVVWFLMAHITVLVLCVMASIFHLFVSRATDISETYAVASETLLTEESRDDGRRVKSSRSEASWKRRTVESESAIISVLLRYQPTPRRVGSCAIANLGVGKRSYGIHDAAFSTVGEIRVDRHVARPSSLLIAFLRLSACVRSFDRPAGRPLSRRLALKMFRII